MDKRTVRRAQQQAILAAIARREWLLRVLALAAAGCRRSKDRAHARASTVTIAYPQGTHALSPTRDLPAMYLVFLPLVGYDDQYREEPRLAQRWEHSPDYREWTFYLRKDARWHDGVPITAYDVKFALEVLSNPTVGLGPAQAEQMLALGAAGCRRGEDRAYSRSTTATIAYEERALNPDYDEPDMRLVFLPLVVENETGELEGRLAERWEHSADYREWTYHLRPGLRWHDSVPVTAHDLKFSLDLLAHPDVLAFGPTAFESVTVLDDLTVTIRTGRIEHADAYNTWPICYPKHRLERLDPKHIADWEFWTHPLGNGPYRFVRYLPQTMIEFEANSDYYRGTPKIEHVRLKFASRESSLTELLSGNVDSTGLEPEQGSMLAGDRRFRVYYDLVGTNVQTIWWQHGHPRECLLQMLALGAVGCRRSDDPAYARGNTLVMSGAQVCWRDWAQ